MNVNPSYEFNPASDNVVEQIVSIREYLAINRYGHKNRPPVQISGQAPEKAALPEAHHRSRMKQPSPGHSYREANSEPISTVGPVNSTEFFERFYIHDHLNIKSCQAKYKAGLTRQHPTSSQNSITVKQDADKADVYELNSHQVISLKGIRVNHTA